MTKDLIAEGGPSQRVAVIGSGIAGLAAAWVLAGHHRVTLYEREDRLGGHTNTVIVERWGKEVAVDTGFIVYNEVNYPNLVQLLARLNVRTRESDMSFGVSLDGGRLEYAGGVKGGLWAQPTNLLRPRYLGMLADIARFFRTAPQALKQPGDGPTLGDYLRDGRYGRAFIEDHLLPMGAAIWSVPLATIADYPAKSFIRFFLNHGLLQVRDRPRWRTVVGGARSYVFAMLNRIGRDVRKGVPAVAVGGDAGGAWVETRTGGRERFDQVVLATHADQALALLASPTVEERQTLGAFRYQTNRALLHADPQLMPRRRRAWASWNYLASGQQPASRQVSLTYWMNRLQGIDPDCPLFVSLNPIVEPNPAHLFGVWDYDHPIFDVAATTAQRRLFMIQGRRRLWFCGSYCGYGFHEDALVSGLMVAEALGVRRPWDPPGATPLMPFGRPVQGLPLPAAAAD